MTAVLILNDIQCVRQRAPHRRQSVVSICGGSKGRKTCASMAGRRCQRSEHLDPVKMGL